METHIKLLGILHVAMAALGVVGAIAILVLFGGLGGMLRLSDHNADATWLPVLSGIGGMVGIVILVLSLPGFIGGIGLLVRARWARVYMIVISALHLLHIPVGTAMGIYGLWVLTRPEAEAILSGPRALSY